MQMDVATTCMNDPGWSPVMTCAKLAARLFGTQLHLLPSAQPSRYRRLLDLRPRVRRDPGRGLLVILRYAHELAALRGHPLFRAGHGYVAAWIIDSPLTETMPLRASFADLDLIGIMRPNDEAAFRRVAGERVVVLGWGADALGIDEAGVLDGERPVDVQRIGRQPPDWDDDDRTAAAMRARGMVFAGRPPLMRDPEANHRAVLAATAQTKFVVAHSNLASPAGYTHPTQEYLTARWTDALAGGAIVAGVQPSTDMSMETLLWRGATINFDMIDLDRNLDVLAEAVGSWTPDLARETRRLALMRLDWRWRFRRIVDHAGMSAPALDAELSRAESRAAALAMPAER